VVADRQLDQTPGPFEMRDIGHLVLELAAEKAQIEHRYEQRLATERRLRTVASGLHRVLEVDAVLDFGAAELGAVLGDRVVVRRIHAVADDAVVAQWFDDGVRPIREVDGDPLPDPLRDLAVLLADRFETACFDDIANDTYLAEETRQHFAAGGARAALLTATRLAADEVLLFEIHEVTRPRRWGETEVVLFEGLIREIVTAVSNAQALEERQLALRTRERLDLEKDEFISNVSHELRTPLTSIIGYLELLQEGDAGDLSSAQAELTDIVARNAGRLLTLVEDLLLLSRIQDHDAPASIEVVDIGAVAAEVHATLVPQARAAGIELSLAARSGPYPVLGDPTELERALLNLAGNAVKFTPAGGQVVIHFDERPETIRIDVIDSGLGIPAAEQERLFERFFRGSAAQQGAVPGSGLGLAISHRIVDRHGGVLQVRSTDGQGTTATIELPIAADHQPEAASDDPVSSLSTDASSAFATNGFVR
jgi:two-component system, OmpR family, phosphate regulon sensor histidine kinase PhoR